ncbi:MAG: nitrous oxide reductase family maturation protein NosD [Saprospiraceae bacterium]
MIVVIFTFNTAVFSKTITVCSTCEFHNISAANEVVVDGDEILVKAGVYQEQEINITKSIILRTDGEVIVDGENKGSVFNISADNVVIDGFVIKNVEQSYIKEYAAIHFYKSRNFTVSNNILENVFFGVLIEKSHDGKIFNNQISSFGKEESSSGNGIHIWHSSRIEVHDNVVHNMRDGIYFEFVTKSKIFNNKSYNNLRYGLHFMFSNNDDYYNNTFSHNGAGVAVMFSKFITMTGNTFIDNWGASSYGLLLKEIYDAEIVNNKFQRNTTGITLEGSTRINYLENDFINNGWAVKVTGACYKNDFRHNNFIGNSFDLSYNGQINDNKFDSNYWSNYAGYDLDKDGIGDVPFRPVKLFSYIVNQTPETIVLLRSLFVDIINFSEKVSPVFTPDNLIDPHPMMKARQ